MEPRPEKGITGRPRAVVALVTVIFAVMVLKLWSLQIVNATRFREMGRSNTVRRVVTKPERGRIFDRNGQPLAANRIRFDASADYGELIGNKQQKQALVNALCKILSLSEEYVEKQLDPSKIIAYVPTKIKREITRDEFLQLKVLEQEIPGLYPEVESVRYYPNGNLAVHILGYTGGIPAEQFRINYEPKGYIANDIIGIAGLEYICEEYLQGEKGLRVVEVDNRSRLISVLPESYEPVKGKDVYLTLEIQIQKLAEKALGENSGAIVIVDPRNGDILAMTSKPAFDPNIFEIPRSDEDIAKIAELMTNKEQEPILNRAISKSYPLGSAFKVITALAGLGIENIEKRISKDTIFDCPGFFSLGNVTWKCYHGHSHGEINIVTAIQKSCNVFFYNLGHRIGREPIALTADLFGLGKKTGIVLPGEVEGVNPTEEWLRSGSKKAKHYSPWVPGLTVNLSIGQYPIEVTPIQVAMLYSAIANGGTLYTPRLLSKILKPEGEAIFVPQGKNLQIPSEYLDIVKEGLILVTQTGGTAYTSFKELQDLKVAGKTSTAEPGKNMDWAYTWFIAFAPYDAPEILVVVLVEKGATGGSTSAPIAAEILKEYFNLKSKPAVKAK
jgi:penicillin-binding protein 2